MTFIFAVRILYEGATCRFKDKKLYSDSHILQKMIFPELIRTPLQSISAFAYLPAGHQMKMSGARILNSWLIVCFYMDVISFAQRSELRLGGSRDSLEEEAFLKVIYTPTARTNSTCLRSIA